MTFKTYKVKFGSTYPQEEERFSNARDAASFAHSRRRDQAFLVVKRSVGSRWDESAYVTDVYTRNIDPDDTLTEIRRWISSK